MSAAIVFIECGLLFPILPGDSLLFAVGLFIAEGSIDLNIVLACLLLTVVAFAGNVVGYEIGRAVGAPLYERDGRFLKKKYFDETHAFFEKYGAKALVLGRFVPIVRTFITVVAGVGRMDRRHFFVWSGVGAALWATGVTLLGYFLGNAFPVLKDHLEVAILAIVRGVRDPDGGGGDPGPARPDHHRGDPRGDRRGRRGPARRPRLTRRHASRT